MRLRQVICVLAAVLFAGMAFAAKMSLSEARAKIDKCVSKPATMASVIKQLAPADQVSFLAEVNEAISKMPGSPESKAATYLDVNREAVRSADAGNKTAMIAEVFATVPPEVLTVVNESFAAELLNRNTGASQKITDDQYVKVSQNIMSKVAERCASAENSAVRQTFAVLMLVRADNGKMAGLPEALIKSLPETAQTAARTEWIPAALGQSQEKSYLPLLGSADTAGEMAANAVVIRLAGPQLLESMLAEVVEGTPMVNNSNNIQIQGEGVRESTSVPQPPVDPARKPDPEPGPYGGQNMAGTNE